MQQMMQAFGQLMSMPMNMFADMMSRSMQTFGGDMTSWTRRFTGCLDRRDDCDRSSDGWRDPGRRERDWDCDSWGDRDDDDCTQWRDGSRCHDGGRDGWRDGDGGDRWGKSDRCSCGGWGCERDDCCYRRRYRCGDRRSDRVRLVEYTLVSIGRGQSRGVLEHGQRVVRDDVSREEFNNQVIADYGPSPGGARNLRVFSRILDSWCREYRDYEEEQIDALEGIRDALRSDELRRKNA